MPAARTRAPAAALAAAACPPDPWSMESRSLAGDPSREPEALSAKHGVVE